jgi:hypothetical protein
MYESVELHVVVDALANGHQFIRLLGGLYENEYDLSVSTRCACTLSVSKNVNHIAGRGAAPKQERQTLT